MKPKNAQSTAKKSKRPRPSRPTPIPQIAQEFSEALIPIMSRFDKKYGADATHEGDVLAGESRFCWKLGTVKSTNAELTKAVMDMGSCNRCGLETGLAQEHKRAIGLSSLFLARE